MSEGRRTIRAGINDVVSELAFLRIELCQMANALRNLVVGACSVSADAEAADARPLGRSDVGERTREVARDQLRDCVLEPFAACCG